MKKKDKAYIEYAFLSDFRIELRQEDKIKTIGCSCLVRTVSREIRWEFDPYKLLDALVSAKFHNDEDFISELGDLFSGRAVVWDGEEVLSAWGATDD